METLERIGIINGSPRGEKGACGSIIKHIEEIFSENFNLTVFDTEFGNLANFNCKDIEKSEIYNMDKVMLVFPLYADSFPSNLLYFLRELENNKEKFKENVKLYTFVNCGLYEGFQAKLAIDMVKLWSEKMSFEFIQGMGYGGSGALPMAKRMKLGEGIKKDLKDILEKLFNIVSEKETGGENIYASINISREEYQSTSEAGWRKLAKRNGLNEEDLDKRYFI